MTFKATHTHLPTGKQCRILNLVGDRAFCDFGESGTPFTPVNYNELMELPEGKPAPAAPPSGMALSMQNQTVSTEQWVMNFLLGIEAAGKHAPTSTMQIVIDKIAAQQAEIETLREYIKAIEPD